MPSFIVFDEITDVGPEQLAAVTASPMCREPELQGTLITRAHLPMQTLSPFLLGSQERATERPDPAPQAAPAPLTAKDLAEARENARPQVTKNVKPGDTVRK